MYSSSPLCSPVSYGNCACSRAPVVFASSNVLCGVLVGSPPLTAMLPHFDSLFEGAILLLVFRNPKALEQAIETFTKELKGPFSHFKQELEHIVLLFDKLAHAPLLEPEELLSGLKEAFTTLDKAMERCSSVEEGINPALLNHNIM